MMRSWVSQGIGFFFSPLRIFGLSKKKEVEANRTSTSSVVGLPFPSMLHTPCHMPTIHSTIGGGAVMPIRNSLGGQHIWQKNSNPILPRRCHKVTGQKSPLFIPPPPMVGSEGSYPPRPRPSRSNFPPALLNEVSPTPWCHTLVHLEVKISRFLSSFSGQWS